MALDDLVNKAKDLFGQGGGATGGAGDSSSSMVDKVKDVATDEHIDQVAGVIKDKTPDNVDGVVDQVADKAKDLNN